MRRTASVESRPGRAAGLLGRRAAGLIAPAAELCLSANSKAALKYFVPSTAQVVPEKAFASHDQLFRVTVISASGKLAKAAKGS